MIDVPKHPRYFENMERCKDYHLPCIVCGKACKNPRWRVRLFWGDTIVTKEEADKIIAEQGEGGDLGNYPLGSDCLRTHPELKPYAIKEETGPKHPCVKHKTHEGVYSFTYQADGKPRTAYWCEECAASMHYKAFNQPLEPVRIS